MLRTIFENATRRTPWAVFCATETFRRFTIIREWKKLCFLIVEENDVLKDDPTSNTLSHGDQATTTNNNNNNNNTTTTPTTTPKNGNADNLRDDDGGSGSKRTSTPVTASPPAPVPAPAPTTTAAASAKGRPAWKLAFSGALKVSNAFYAACTPLSALTASYEYGAGFLSALNMRL
uniref:Uncharacterized protein n=1 Tax=Vespula pensylvanica TaxID=30213 RepID=A0A834P395_VESPE|nr:hypothetical protein H0235_006632 [Vespula pensylvanica]